MKGQSATGELLLHQNCKVFYSGMLFAVLAIFVSSHLFYCHNFFYNFWIKFSNTEVYLLWTNNDCIFRRDVETGAIYRED